MKVFKKEINSQEELFKYKILKSKELLEEGYFNKLDLKLFWKIMNKFAWFHFCLNHDYWKYKVKYWALDSDVEMHLKIKFLNQIQTNAILEMRIKKNPKSFEYFMDERDIIVQVDKCFQSPTYFWEKDQTLSYSYYKNWPFYLFVYCLFKKNIFVFF